VLFGQLVESWLMICAAVHADKAWAATGSATDATHAAMTARTGARPPAPCCGYLVVRTVVASPAALGAP
jgi:hypothetical protein